MSNPTIIRNQPTADRIEEVVETRSSRAMGLFAIVLVVITFILNQSKDMSSPEELTLALTTTLLAAGFLILVFVSETHGIINKFWHRLQEDALYYSGLLLFTGLYFIVRSIEVSNVLKYTVSSFIVLA